MDQSYHLDVEIFNDNVSNFEFDYLYLFIKDRKKIWISKKLDNDYLSYINGLGIDSDQIELDFSKTTNWWTSSTSLTKLIEINSKINWTAWCKEKNWQDDHFQCNVKKTKDIKDVLSQTKYQKFVLKEGLNFSGKGFIHFNRENIPLIDGDYVLSPWFEREKDFGVNYNIKGGKIDTRFVVENFNSKNGQFRGGKLARLEKEVLNLTDRIAEFYIQKGAQTRIGIDLFKTTEGEFIISEVNCRKTMADFIYDLADIFGEGSFFLTNKKKLNSFSNHEEMQRKLKGFLYTKENKKGIILLAPLNRMFFSYYYVGSEKDLKKIKRILFS